MITPKRSDLSPVSAINTSDGERQGQWLSDADTERGRWREVQKENWHKGFDTDGGDKRQRSTEDADLCHISTPVLSHDQCPDKSKGSFCFKSL